EHPVVILFAGAGIDYQQEVVFAEAVDDYVVHEGACGVEHGRILALADGHASSIVHGDVLHGSERLRTMNPDVAHVAHVKDANRGANRHVLSNEAGGILHGHVPAIEVHHAGAQTTMKCVQRGWHL